MLEGSFSERYGDKNEEFGVVVDQPAADAVYKAFQGRADWSPVVVRWLGVGAADGRMSAGGWGVGVF